MIGENVYVIIILNNSTLSIILLKHGTPIVSNVKSDYVDGDKFQEAKVHQSPMVGKTTACLIF